MTAQLSPTTVAKFTDNNGAPLAFGSLTTYAAGTTTPIPTYVDSTLTTQNLNPIQLNFRGECNLWLDPTKTYKFLLQDSQGNIIPGWPIDNITIGNANPSYNVVPTTDNLYALGSPSFSWANIYVGPMHAPVLETVSGNIGYYARTATEISASVTPVNYAYPPCHVYRYGAVGDGTTDDSGAVQTALTVAAGYQAVTRSASQRNIPAAYFPSGAYLIKTPLTVPNGNGVSVHCENDAYFFYNDTLSVGSYMLTMGASGGSINGVGWDRLRINLLTVTAKGLNLINCQDSYFDDIYCQGLVVASGSMSSRTNVGLRIESTSGQNSFFLRLGNLHLNHCHTGIYVPDSGGFVGQVEIRYLNLYGDAVGGDQSSLGVNAQAGQDWIVHGGYIESYYNTPGSSAGIALSGAKCVRWKVSKIVFDYGSSPSGHMIAISLGGGASSNQFLQCFLDPATISLNDGTAPSLGNLIENNPNVGNTWTVSLVPSTSGTITLQNVAGGNQGFCIKRGNEVHIWGSITVQSVSSPVGRLQLEGLPFNCANNAGCTSAATIYMTGATATAATQMMGVINSNTAILDIDHFATGNVGNAAGDVIAGTVIDFNVIYPTVTAT